MTGEGVLREGAPALAISATVVRELANTAGGGPTRAKTTLSGARTASVMVLDGTLHIQPAPRQGTTVRARLSARRQACAQERFDAG